VQLAILAAAPVALASLGPPEALDGRAWELVSPPQKNGGDVEPPAPGRAVLQAGAGGGSIAFGSAASFGLAEGAAPASQYLAARAAGGWETTNLTPPLLAGTYAAGPYQLFSDDLARGLLSSGWSCRLGAASCTEDNPPLGPGAPGGYRNLYLREGSGYRPLITTADAPALALSAENFHLALAGATPDLRHVVFATCAALTPAAEEVPAPGGGCEAGAPNLYEWTDGTLAAVNILPGDTETTPGARLAASAGAISSDGSRVYFSGLEDGPLYLREGSTTHLVPESVGDGAAFQLASADGSVAYFTAGGTLYRFAAATLASEAIATEVAGVLGASADGSYVYYLTSGGLRLWHEGSTKLVAAGAAAADPADYQPATGSARVTPDGTHLAFLSKASLTGYANVGKAEVFLYDATIAHLTCVSCNPREMTPAGPSLIPGAYQAGEGGEAAYKPRALTDDGRRIFFTSADALLFSDSDGRPDVYEWEAKGTGSCALAIGCLALVSGGHSGEASFLDASADGSDAYFLTEVSLLPSDPSSVDVYDARAGGGFAEPTPVAPCEGDACQGPPPGPDDATLASIGLESPPNPPVRFGGHKRHRRHHHRARRHRHRHGGGRR